MEKKPWYEGETRWHFFLAVAFIVGNTENIVLLRQQMRHYKSVALLHIFCIQLEFGYLPWNHSPAYISAVSCARTGHQLKREILCVIFFIVNGKRKRRFGILFLRKHWHSAQKHAFQLCECFCPELFHFKIGLWDLNIRTHHVGNPKTI